MSYKSTLLFLLLISFVSSGQVVHPDSIRMDLDRSLTYLAENQTRETIEGKQYRGEWEAYMRMKGFFFLLGPRNKYRDSNCFTMAGIYNSLAELYLADTSKKQILPMLDKVYPEILSYSTGNRFNFWKNLPPRRDLQMFSKEPDPVPKVRRPTTFLLEERFMNNAANVENDADDTSMGNLAVWYHQKIFGGHDTLQRADHRLFDSYVDKDRYNRHWYNYLFHGFRNSGAYMTWFGQEKELTEWSFHKVVLHNMVFFMPFSICYPHAYEPYIPWGANDVDVVVNANVLTYLSKSGQVGESAGSARAGELIRKHARRGRWNRMGIYYPNRYHFHYAVSRALASGDTALVSSSQYLIRHLTKTQHPDGSFTSRRKVNRHDRLQSSVYATLALLYLKESGQQVPVDMIHKSMAFIHSHRKQQGGQTYWEGGVFFSGGTVVRNLLYFTSDAYTTALVALAFQKYERLIKSDSSNL